MPLTRRIGELLASPRARLWVPLAGVLLTLPSLANGLVLDDLFHRLKAQGAFGTSFAARFDVFSFVSGDPAQRAALGESGFLPWFARPDLKLAFFRPVSAALHLFDYNVLDRWPWAMHVESLALYAALIGLVAALYRRLLPLGVAMLGALLYAIDDAHGMPVGWLANRNAVLATTFGVAAILAHDRWRRDGWKLGAVLAPLAFTTALLSAEYGLGALAYLVAHAVTLDPAPRAKRAWALAPYAAIVVAWQIAYRKLGYGAFGSGMYVDPIADPGGFVRALPEHTAALFLGQLALPPADLLPFTPGLVRAALVAFAIAFGAFVTWLLLPKLRAEPFTRFLALGMVLAIAPVVASNPSDRLLLFTGIGAFGLVAQVIGDLRDPAPAWAAPRARSARTLRTFWIATNLVLAPLLLPITCTVLGVLGSWAERVTASVPNGPELAKQTVILTNLPTIFMGQPWLFPIDPHRVLPKRIRAMALTTGHVYVSREDARTLLITLAPDAAADPLIMLFRDHAHPFAVGEEGDAPGLHATIVSLGDDGAMASVRYLFDRDLDDPSFRWIAWNGASLYDTKAPPIGARVTFGPP